MDGMGAMKMSRVPLVEVVEVGGQVLVPGEEDLAAHTGQEEEDH